MFQNNPRIILLLFALAIFQATSIQFSVELQPDQKFCFYQMLESQQKYSFFANPNNPAAYTVQVSHIYDRAWKTVFYRSSTLQQRKTIRVDKLASTSTTYSFCVTNNEQSVSSIGLQFSSGMDMMELTSLPDKTDSENIQRQLNWLQGQLTKIYEKAQSIQEFRRISTQMHGMIGIKMIVLGLVGLAGIAGVNLVFFKLLKNQLKKRKYI